MRRLVERAALYYISARHRAARRKSPWNVFVLVLGFATGLGLWSVFFRVVWAVHVVLYPSHSFRDFWPRGISFSSFVPSFLLLFAPFFGAMTLGFAFGNCIAWLIKPARRVFDAEAVGYPGTGFREATTQLLKVAGWATPAGLMIAFTAAYALESLR